MSSAESVTSVGTRRRERYREIASILWDERVLFLFKDTGVGDYAPSGATLDEVADDDPEQQGRGAPREVRVRRALERLGPTFVKMGQLPATRQDLISPLLAAELSELKDDVPTVASTKYTPSSRPSSREILGTSRRTSIASPWPRLRWVRSTVPSSAMGERSSSRCSDPVLPR